MESKKTESGSESKMDIDEAIEFQKRKNQIDKSQKSGENSHNIDNLKNHDENHRNNSTYCYKCDKIFVEKDDYVKHQEKHKEKITFKCEVCDKLFCTNNEPILHIKIHKSKHEKRNFNSSKCGKEYSDMNICCEYKCCMDKCHCGC